MQTARHAIGRATRALALAAGLSTLALAPVAAQADGFHGGGGFGGGFHGGGGVRGGGGFHGGGFGGFRGGYGGYRGGYGGFGYRGCCYGGYYGGFGLGDALLGAALIGGTAAIIASNDQPVYETYPAPVYPVYPPPVAVAPPAAYGYAPPPPEAEYRSGDPVEQCSRAAVDEAASRGDSGRVTRIDRVDGYQNGAHVTGTLEVRRASRGGAVENARFTCTADFGHVTAFRFG